MARPLFQQAKHAWWIRMPDHRRERGRRNRLALLEAALELFASAGFETTTVEQIADRARVAPRTFFHHFPSKEDVLFDGYAERLDEVSRRFRSSGSVRSLWEAMFDVAAAVAESIVVDPYRYLERARLYDEAPVLRARMLLINEEWIDNMTSEIARHLGLEQFTDPRPRLAATLLNGANRVAIEVWSASGGRADLSKLMAESLALLRPTIDRIERSAAVSGGRRAS